MNNNLDNFDDNIKNLVEGYSHSFNNAAWEDLEARLNRPNELIYKVFQYKLIEAALLLFMLWFALSNNKSGGYDAALPSSSTTSNFKQVSHSQAANQASTGHKANLKEEVQNAPLGTSGQNSSVGNGAQAQLPPAPINSATQSVFHKTTSTKASATTPQRLIKPTINKSTSTPSSPSAQVAPAESGQLNRNVQNNNSIKLAAATGADANPNSTTSSSSSEVQQSVFLDYLPLLAYNSTTPLIAVRKAVGPEFARTAVKPKAVKRPTSLFGAFSPDYNTFTNTPKSTTGFSLYAGAEKYLSKRFVLQLGANYRYLQYLTETSVEEQRNEFNILNNTTRAVSVNMLSFQAATKIIIFENKDLLLYGRLGLVSDFLVGNSVKSRVTTLVNNSIVQETNVATALESNEKGFLQNGDIARNILLSADLGIGSEFKATKYTSLFIEALYNKGITSGGLHNEQINKAALKFGFKHTLK
jgi:hypothetical protein